MQNETAKIGLKYAIIFILSCLTFDIYEAVTSFGYNDYGYYGNPYGGFFSAGLGMGLSFFYFSLCIGFGLYELRKQNNNILNFKDSLALAGIIMGVDFVWGYIYGFVSRLFSGYETVYYGNEIETHFNLMLTVWPLVISIIIALTLIMMASMWIIFEKAGEKGWSSLIPFHSFYCMLRMANKPNWWMILYLNPITNIVVSIWAMNRIVKRLGYNEGHTVGIVFFPMIFLPIVGLGDNEFNKEME